MKKFIVLAAIVGVLSGFVTATTPPSSDFYVRIGSGSGDANFALIVGQKGVDWDCDWQIWNTCTYIKTGANQYQEYESGELEFITAKN